MANGRFEPVNDTFRVIFKATGVPQKFPSMNVPTGCAVYVRALNGLVGGNVAPIVIARTPEDCLAGQSGENLPIGPNNREAYPCQSTGEIWGMGTAGDGATVTIQG
jgi:hypothetical protein